MARKITTDTFLTITGPGINIKTSRALQDSSGNVAVWWKPNGAPQKMFTSKAPIGMRGTMTDADGNVVNYRRRGVSCTWAICKGKFTTRQVAAWWPDDNSTAPEAVTLAAKVANVEESPERARAVAAAATRRSARTRPTSAAGRRAARARALAARAARDEVNARRAAAEQPPAGIDPDAVEALADDLQANPLPDPPADVPELFEEEAPAADGTDPLPAEPEPEPAEPSPVLVADLGLATRTTNALTDAGVTTLHQLAGQTEDTLTALSGIGPKAVSEISDALHAHGYVLGS